MKQLNKHVINLSFSCLTLGMLLGCNPSTSQTTAQENKQTELTSQVSIVDQIEIPFEKFTLPNGLRVIVHSNHNTPIVNVAAWYHVGSKDEPKGKSGFAHLFEHIMTTGTENFPHSMLNAYKGIGATGLNATTSYDRTRYFQTVPTGALDRALWLESDRMLYTLGAITQEKLDLQRGVVQNERKGGQSSSYYEELLYPENHPYSHSVIGNEEDLNSASLDDIQQWFKSYYGANNAVLVLSGDVTVAKAKELVNKYFAAAKPSPTTIRELDNVPTKLHNQTYRIENNTRAPLLTTTWNVAPWHSLDVKQLTLLAKLLSEKNSRFNQALTSTDEITKVSVNFEPFELTGRFAVSLTLTKSANSEKAAIALNNALNDLMENGVDETLLSRRISRFLMGNISRLENVSYVADLLAEGEMFANDPNLFFRQLKQLENNRSIDMQKVAKRWLKNGYTQILMLPKAKLTSTEDSVDRSQVPTLTQKKAFTLPTQNISTLNNGIKLYSIKREGLPISTVTLMFNAEQLAETELYLLGDIVPNLLIDKQSLKEWSEQMGVKLYTNADKGYLTISVSGMNNNLMPVANTLIDNLAHLTVIPEALSKGISRQLKVQKRQQSRGARPTDVALVNALFGKDVKAPVQAASIDVNSVSITQAQAWLTALLSPKNVSAFSVGSLAESQLKSSLNESLGSWPVTGQASPFNTQFKSKKSVVAAEPLNQSKVIVIDKPGANQTGVFIARPGLNSDHQDYNAFNIATRIFGRMGGGRLHENLREDKGWTYIATSGHRRIKGQWVWSASSYVQADKTIDTINELRKEVNHFIGDKPVTEQELNELKSDNLGKMPARFGSSNNLLSAALKAFRNDKPFSDALDKSNEIQQLNLQQVQNISKEVIGSGPLVFVLHGDYSNFEAELKQLNLGEVTLYKP